jgi:hypothetical protein
MKETSRPGNKETKSLVGNSIRRWQRFSTPDNLHFAPQGINIADSSVAMNAGVTG